MFSLFIDTIKDLAAQSGLAVLGWQNVVMILISFVFMYLAIRHKFEPLLLLPIAFGMLLTNLPNTGLYHPELWNIDAGHELNFGDILHNGGLLDMLYLGVKLQIYPALIFLGIGCMTDFAPLIANPKSFLLGAAAQAGIFLTFIGAAALGFNANEAGSIAIIGGADGPTSIYVSSLLLKSGGYQVEVGTIALAAYTYMALVPLIQPPIMRLLTTKKERLVRMTQLRQVSKTEKIIFPIAVTIIIALLVPSAAPLVGMLMLGNLFKESGVVDRITKTAQNELMNIITIFLGVSVGATTVAEKVISVAFIRRWYCFRRTLRKAHVPCYKGQGKSPYRFRRRFCRSYGCKTIPEGRSRSRPHKLPAHARYGTKCCRCYRLRSCSGRSPEHYPSLSYIRF